MRLKVGQYANENTLSIVIKSTRETDLDFALEQVRVWLKTVYNSSSISEVKSEFELFLSCNCNVIYTFDNHAKNFVYSEERLICIDPDGC